MSSSFLALPRELRDEILGYLTLPQYVYTSSSTKDTRYLHRSHQTGDNTYIDTRISLARRPPANLLATCRQLRHECLEHHARHLHATPLGISPNTEEQPMSNVLAARLGTEFAEEAERACDDGALRITMEIQKSRRGQYGYYVPVRDQLSPRFLALLPFMQKAKKVRFALWPGFDWWNGCPPALVDKRGNARVNPDAAPKPNAASKAITEMLQYFPHVEDLNIDVLMEASDGGRWDLPDRKWENIQPWLDAPIAPNVRPGLVKITRRLIAFWKASEPEPFYVQHEVRETGDTWKVDRVGDMATPTMVYFCDTSNAEDMEFLNSVYTKESFHRTDQTKA